jgi:hypothetical protein
MACVLVLGGGLAGCSNKITANSVRSDMSPGLTSMSENDQQLKNRHARTFDTNFRQIPDDIDTILLFDRPGRLSPYAVP